MKIKAFFGVTLVALSLSILPTSVLAQSQTGGAQQPRSTTISGKIVRMGDDDFVIDTGKGQVLVDADDEPVRQAKLAVGQQVTVTGQQDDDNFDAYTITGSNGKVITVRD